MELGRKEGGGAECVARRLAVATLSLLAGCVRAGNIVVSMDEIERRRPRCDDVGACARGPEVDGGRVLCKEKEDATT